VVRADFLIVGGGIMGISVARKIKQRYADTKVVLIEKEVDCGLHASGRNSGVLHAGFYYSPEGLKARYTQLGNRALTEYCRERNLRVNNCGKLVVARNETEHVQLDELLRRGKVNGVPLESVSEAEARLIEPRVKTHGRAIFSPTTSSVNPIEVLQAMKDDAVREGIEVHTGVSYISSHKNTVKTSLGNYQADYVVNAAGLYADRIANDFGFSAGHCILPFKGLYLYSDEPPGSIRTNIYPVPDLQNPFLGVHYTLAVDDKVKIGPTAIPAFWREQYEGAGNFKFSEFLEIVPRQVKLYMSSSFDFKKLAIEEMRKYSRTRMVELASHLIEGVNVANYKRWARPGIRAQLLNLKTQKLEMDFVLEGDDRSMHILNAVSPAFTCALPFSEYVCAEIDKSRH
jgi:(S)-2-hydroxyglutarate dehydrogenase